MPVHRGNELAELLDGFGDPGILVIGGGFETLAAAPDLAGTLDSHSQFTHAVKRFARISIIASW